TLELRWDSSPDRWDQTLMTRREADQSGPRLPLARGVLHGWLPHGRSMAAGQGGAGLLHAFRAANVSALMPWPGQSSGRARMSASPVINASALPTCASTRNT